MEAVKSPPNFTLTDYQVSDDTTSAQAAACSTVATDSVEEESALALDCETTLVPESYVAIHELEQIEDESDFIATIKQKHSDKLFPLKWEQLEYTAEDEFTPIDYIVARQVERTLGSEATSRLTNDEIIHCLVWLSEVHCEKCFDLLNEIMQENTNHPQLKESLGARAEECYTNLKTFYPAECALLCVNDLDFDAYSTEVQSTDSTDFPAQTSTARCFTLIPKLPSSDATPIDETDSVLFPKPFTVEIHDPIYSRENREFYNLRKLRGGYDRIDQKNLKIDIPDEAHTWFKSPKKISFKQSKVYMDNETTTNTHGKQVPLLGSEVHPTTIIKGKETRKGQLWGGNLLSLVIEKCGVINVLGNTPKDRVAVGERVRAYYWLQVLIKDGNVTLRKGLGNYQDIVEQVDTSGGKLVLHMKQDIDDKASKLPPRLNFDTLA